MAIGANSGGGRAAMGLMAIGTAAMPDRGGAELLQVTGLALCSDASAVRFVTALTVLMPGANLASHFAVACVTGLAWSARLVR